MTTNPLALRAPIGGGGGIGREGLELYAAQLNEMNFSRACGYHWFINERLMPNGTTQAYLDRRG